MKEPILSREQSMIDQDKMRALAARHREEAELAEYANRNTYAAFMREAADAIDLLLAEVEVAATDRRDAERYRWLRKEHFPTTDNPPLAQVVWKALGDRHQSQWANTIDGNDLDKSIDAALAQRQGEGS